jgi:hypothetical protein
MADEILLKYGADLSGLKDAQVEIKKVTTLTEELGTEIKATFSEKSLDEAVVSLVQQGKTMDALILKYGDAGKALKAMQKELQTMAALGQRGTAEFKELSKATAELQDSIGDTRGEIKKLASDTRVFDTIAQGARGITAAFSVATGITAIFGKENEDLQKSLLKVQGALATLQGVQELANIATEEGGIATVAYGVALKGVELISKTFGISMAASWAVATAGLSVLVAGVIALVVALQDAKKETDSYTQAVDDNRKAIEKNNAEIDKNAEIQKSATKNTIEQIDIEVTAIKEKQKQNQAALDAAAIASNMQSGFNEELTGEVKRLQALDRQYTTDLIVLSNQRKFAIQDEAKVRGKAFGDLMAKQIAEMRDTDKILEEAVFETLPDEVRIPVSKVTFEPTGDFQADLTKLPELALPVTIAPLSADLAAQKFMTEFAQTLNEIAPTVSAFQSLFQSIYAGETQALEEEKQKQLSLVGDNAQKREQIEKTYAIKRAQLAREQAIADKSFAIFGAVVNIASAISKTLADNGLPAAIPFIALAAATGAAQIAAIAAAPLPSIPKFDKGGAVPLMGGNIRTDGGIIGRSHRHGGVLIEAEGGEYITNKIASQKYADELKAANNFRLEDLILHKYVAPALKAANAAYAESYDDRMLRRTIERTSERNAQTISKAVGQAVSESSYFKSRYGL